MQWNNAYSENNQIAPPSMYISYAVLLLLLVFAFIFTDQLTLWSFILCVAIMLFPGWLLHSMRVGWQIDQERIDCWIYPIWFLRRTIALDDVSKFALVEFDALRHFMGYGYGRSRKYGIGYIASSGTGLLIRMKNGKQIVLSVENPDALLRTLHNLQIPVEGGYEKKIVPINHYDLKSSKS